MTGKEKEFIDYLEISAAMMVEEEKKLILDERKDEANLIKIKKNIFDIFRTVFLSIMKDKTVDEKNIKMLFTEKMDTIPKNWKISYENAKIHNDVEKIVIEEIKFQTLDLISTKFNELWGEII